MSNDSLNDLFVESAPSFTFENVGDTCKGVVVGAEKRQQTDLDTGEKKFFPSGDPMWMTVITIDQSNGDGQTAIYCKGGKYEVDSGKGLALLPAVQEAIKGKDFRPGGELAVQFSGLGKKTKAAYSAPKLYTVQYREPAITISDDDPLL